MADRYGTLYVVATPIGNLEDITARALRTLEDVSLVACEDTRHSRKLMNHFGLSTPLTAYHEHNEEVKSLELLNRLRQGKDLALISDAGTPAIADPGFRLVRLCREENIPVVPIPGASAVTAALSVSGLPSDRFAFEGFLPAKATARQRQLAALSRETRTLVFYESPHRLTKTLADMTEAFGADRSLVVGRELTKLHEEWVRGTAEEVLGVFREDKVRGEVVILAAPAEEMASDESVEEALLRWRKATDLPWKQIVKQVAREKGVPGDEVYRKHLEVKHSLELE